MGKGDQKSKKGKINAGTYGVRRPRKKNTISASVESVTKKTSTKSATKTATKKVSKKKAEA